MVGNPIETVWTWSQRRREERDTQEIQRITTGWSILPVSEEGQARYSDEPWRYRMWRKLWAFIESTVPRTPEQVAGVPEYQPRHLKRDDWSARQAFTVNIPTAAYSIVAR